MRLIPMAAAISALVPVLTQAQVIQSVGWPVAAGSRVRVESPAVGNKTQIGSVVSTSGDTLVFRLATDDAAVAVPAPSIVKLDVAQGTHTRKAQGAMYGLLIGVGAGAILGAATYKGQSCTEICIFPDSRAFDATLGGALLGIVGTIVGAVAGSNAVDTWVPVAVPGH